MKLREETEGRAGGGTWRGVATVLVVVMATLIAVTGCNTGGKATDGAQPVATPRRTAYPRLQLPDSTFVTDAALPYGLQPNAGATYSVEDRGDGSVWVNVVYPKLNTTIYFTFSGVEGAELDRAIDNRSERIALNLSGNNIETISLATPNGLTGSVVVDRFGSNTPVQFLATDNRGLVVSGAAFVPNGATAPADSLAPVVDMLQRDIVHALLNVRP